MKNNCRNKGHGFTLIELMITVGILGILTAIAVPYFGTFWQKSNLETANNRIILSLKKAKKIANAEKTFVDVSISNNLIAITPQNRDKTFTLKIPGDIISDSTIQFTFNSTGSLLKPDGNGVDSMTKIRINPAKNASLFRTISISNTGIITSL